MESEGSVPDAHEVAAALRVATGMLYRRLKQTAPVDELTLSESSTLSRLERGGPASSSELARFDRISPQSMGVTVAALEDRRLIVRDRDPEDGRRIVLSITEAGRQLIHDKRGARTGQIAAALGDGFSAAELSQLMAVVPLLERLAEKL
jgi:DNA-binding MarR family transcriptional regulator